MAIAAMLCTVSAAISSCSISNEPSTPRAKEHFDAISFMSTTANKYGFKKSEIKKDCEIALDCTQNDEYVYFSNRVENLDGKVTDEEVCTSLFQLAQETGFDFWRRDDRDPSEEVVDVTSAVNGINSCTQTVAIENDWNPGFIIHGKLLGYGQPIAYFIQLSAYPNEKGFNTYSLIIHTSENAWPIPQTSGTSA